MPLLDTDVMVDVLRNHPPALAWLKSLGDDPVVLLGYVAMELIQGCRNKAEQSKVERVLADCQIVWPSAEACAAAIATFASLHLSSGIGILDVLIGQTSITLGMALCTFNQKHYTLIPGISLLAPYTRTP